VVLVTFRVFSLKWDTAGAFKVPFRALSRKHITGDDMLFLLGATNILSHAHKTGSWYLSGVLFKTFEEKPGPFCMAVPPGKIL